MFNYVLCYKHKKRYKEIYFESITEAYKYYLFYLSTPAEWAYYLKCAKKLLCSVKDEKVMRMIFDNVFSEKVCLCEV